jgi:hypothetical protein
VNNSFFVLVVSKTDDGCLSEGGCVMPPFEGIQTFRGRLVVVE